MWLHDPLLMPVTGETPQERLYRSLPLFDTPGERYVEKRGIPVTVAHDMGLRFDAIWNGRPAVIAAMHDLNNTVCCKYELSINERRELHNMVYTKTAQAHQPHRHTFA
ncbi:MAG: hypothetical protein ABI921_03755 [Panacibacter sp.]